jgi:dihydroorotase
MGELTAPDLVVTGRRLVTPQGVREGILVLGGGVIQTLSPAGSPLPPRIPVLDAGDAYVLPGLIDSHVHFRTPGLTHKEDWANGSRAAAAGGVTTVLDMPNTDPPRLTERDVREHAATIAGDSLVDFRLHVGADPDDPKELSRLDPSVASSAKIFMAGHHTAPTVFRTFDQLDQAFAVAAGTGLQLVLHAEDGGLFDMLDQWWGPPAGYRDYERRRPRTGGISAVARVIELVRRHGTKAHILHLSSREEADLVCAAAAAGLPVTFELTAHHLSFTAADTARVGARTRLAPAIRDQADQDRLWEALFDGQVMTIGSDHAPHTVAEKTRSVQDSPPGLPGVQELGVAIWTGMRRRRPHEPADVAACRLARHLAERPADLFGLSRKGRIAAGYDADLVFLDPNRTWMLSAGDVRAKCGWSAYEGWTMTGRVVRTIRRGETIWDDSTGSFGTASGAWIR